jgi:hypothetical protein
VASRDCSWAIRHPPPRPSNEFGSLAIAAWSVRLAGTGLWSATTGSSVLWGDRKASGANKRMCRSQSASWFAISAKVRTAVAPPYKLEWERGERKMLIISIGAGSIPRLGPTAENPSRSIFEVASGIAGELMSGMAYDQDINCRTVGRCVFGAPLDREVGDLVPDVALEQDLGRDFLYARYNPELTREGLGDLGLAAIDPARVAKLDSVAAIDELLLVGRRYAEKYLNTQSHFGPFFPACGG